MKQTRGSMSSLNEILNALKTIKQNNGKQYRYAVPTLWTDVKLKCSSDLEQVHPIDFFIGRIESILRSPARACISSQGGAGGTWSKNAVVYNLFVRLATALDHDQNGQLDLPVNSDGFRETGTFLKAISLLPYMRKLGANTVHLLPVTAIGKDGNKGTLGSPYAIRNPYHLDENLSEPFLGLGAEKEFKAFVEAAHHLGMKVIAEFVFRTAAKDSDWVKEHPEWFYWIKETIENRSPGSSDPARYGSPIFDHDSLRQVRERVERGELSNTIPPPQSFREMFREPPKSEEVQMESGRWIGTLKDGTRVKIPGAFADWPPDDTQPPWGDVTYLKMYDHPQFNYIAYNTIRMYDTGLAQKQHQNSALWEKIVQIIPHYQKEFGIDGVMIDMGHALPLPLLERMEQEARKLDPDFAFWEENFNPTEDSKKHGYNAAVGYIWSDECHAHKLKNLLKRYSEKAFPLPFFGTSENHNTPRAAARPGGINYSRFSWGMNCFLPVLPFIHNGFELGEDRPVNTGLDFKAEELEKFPSEKLALFSEASLQWSNSKQFCSWLAKVTALRKKYEGLLTDADPSTFHVLHQEDHNAVAFRRKKGKNDLLVLGNMNMTHPCSVKVPSPGDGNVLKDMIAGKTLPGPIQHEMVIHLEPGEVRVLGMIFKKSEVTA